jgi:4-hydroxybenzoate polyprenyltransferase
MTSSNIVIEYARLGRIHSSVLSGLAPAIGAMVMGLAEIKLIIILFIIGVLTHIFGFTANEIIDIEIDKKSPDLKNKPLVKGTISKSGALIFVISSLILAYIFAVIFFYLKSDDKSQMELIFPIILLTLSWLSIGAYDMVSKKMVGSDALLALWPFFLVLFGGSIISLELSPILYIVAGLAFMQLFIQNIMAGLKDIDHDKKGGGVSTPLRFGVKIKSLSMNVPLSFHGYILFLKIVYISLIFLPFVMEWVDAKPFQIILIMVPVILTSILTYLICRTQRFDREKIIKYIGGHEILAYTIIPLILVDVIGIWFVVALLMLPIIWLRVFLQLMYRGVLPEI